MLFAPGLLCVMSTTERSKIRFIEAPRIVEAGERYDVIDFNRATHLAEYSAIGAERKPGQVAIAESAPGRIVSTQIGPTAAPVSSARAPGTPAGRDDRSAAAQPGRRRRHHDSFNHTRPNRPRMKSQVRRTAERNR